MLSSRLLNKCKLLFVVVVFQCLNVGDATETKVKQCIKSPLLSNVSVSCDSFSSVGVHVKL